MHTGLMNPAPSSGNQPLDWVQQHGDLQGTQVEMSGFISSWKTNWTLLGMS